MKKITIYSSLLLIGLFTITNLTFAMGSSPYRGAYSDEETDIFTKKTYCYKKSLYDKDNDGWAKDVDKELARIIYLDDSKRFYCPAGYTPYKGDCNDSAPNIHPNQLETAFNNIDDNCRNGKDETGYVYYDSGYSNQKTSFKIRAKINKYEIKLKQNQGHQIFVKVRYKKVKHLNWIETAEIPVTIRRYNHSGIGRYYAANIKLANLSSATVYMAQVKFYYGHKTILLEDRRNKSLGYSGLQQITDYDHRKPEYNSYYTTTTQTSKVSKARTKILLRGFKQLWNYQRGRVGRNGTDRINGTMYGATQYERWCTEFYAWVAQDFLFFVRGISNTRRMQTYYGRQFERVFNLDDISGARRGDWLAIDYILEGSDRGDGEKDHTGMFLAKREDGKIITLEGNKGNRVAIGDHPIEQIYGYGHITSDRVK